MSEQKFVYEDEQEVARIKFTPMDNGGMLVRMDDDISSKAFGFSTTQLELEITPEAVRDLWTWLKRNSIPQKETSTGPGIYEVWCEGYRATGDFCEARYLGQFEAETFKDAVELALDACGWDRNYYNAEKLTHWGCGFYDNEAAARRFFG